MTGRDEPITEPLKIGDRVRVNVAATVLWDDASAGGAGVVRLVVDAPQFNVQPHDVRTLRRIVPDWSPHPTGTLLKDPEGRLWSVGGNGPMVLIATHMTHPLYAVRSQSYESSQWTVLFTPPPDEVREWS